jgi:hypothetical protein
MNKTFEQIEQEIRAEFTNYPFRGITDTEEFLSSVIGKNVSHYDTKFDDGCEDDEDDDYVMKACFDTDDNEYTIHIYYGDNTEIVGCVDVIHRPLPEPEPKSIFNVICLYSYDYEEYAPIIITCTSKEIALKQLKREFEWHKSETYLKTYFDENDNIIEDEVDEFSIEDDRISIYDGAKPFKFDIYIEENILYEN